MDKLIINTMREGYGLDQIKNTMTVAELKALLDDYEDETPIYLSFDNGYTYGGIIEERVELAEGDDEEYTGETEDENN